MSSKRSEQSSPSPGPRWGLVRRWADWDRLSIRRRILVSMVAVSVIPLALFSLVALLALTGLNSGALRTANHELVANQGAHLGELVRSKADIVNGELASVQTQTALLARAAEEVLANPPTPEQAEVGSNATIFGPGASSPANPQVASLQSLEGEMTLISELHPEVAEVWLQLPQSGLLAVSPADAVPLAQRSRFEDLLPSPAEYQLGVEQQEAADQLQSGRWRQLVGQLPATASWTPVYSNPMAGGQTVTVTTEGTTGDGLQFRVGANITVNNLVSSFLAGPPGSAQGSYAFLVSAEGTVITVGRGGISDLDVGHRGKRTQAVNLTSPTNPWYRTASDMRLGLQGSQLVSLDGAQVEVFYSPLPASGWSFGVAIPVSGLDSSVVGFSQQISRGLAGITALLIPVLILLALLAVAFTEVLSRRLLGPLSRLTSASARIAGGDLDTQVGISPGGPDEIGSLERALERMRRRLGTQQRLIARHQQELEHKVEERTAELSQRNQELATLNSVTGEMSRSLVVTEVANTAVARLQQAWGLPWAAVYLADELDPSGLRMVGRAPAAPEGTDQEAAPPADIASLCRGDGVGAAQKAGLLLLPLTTAGTRVGYLALRHQAVVAPRQLELLEVLGGQLALALRNAQLFADTQELATINERNRIAREIHDTLAQGLAGIIVQLQAADAWLEREPSRAAEAVDHATELARSSLQEARRSVWDLRPELIQQAGLVAALRQEVSRLRNRSGARISLRQRGTRGLALSSRVEVAVFRIVQEALANSLNHGRAGRVAVEMALSGDRLRVTVGDDGDGFEPAGQLRPGSFGLTSMRERADACGGSLEVISSPGRGTTVVLEVPCADLTAETLAP